MFVVVACRRRIRDDVFLGIYERSRRDMLILSGVGTRLACLSVLTHSTLVS